MALSLKFTNEAFPPGTEFHLEGVGLIVNGESTELTEEQENGFIAANRILLKDSTADSEMYEVTGEAAIASVADSLGVDPEEISNTAPIVQPVVEEEVVEEPVATEGTIDLGGGQ